ncbi:MAG: hypothetical protein Q7T45_14825 [Bradyrhizobium sp.]|uniref:hypothetical protein n=1 Tax=Bradyrhizobium sp. TaxID=376 RepID=UPI002716A790|nr:hypothetical protein [Bradyrhizobium sp.]MDO8399085.1 hypothetical protein [Bradyrhizobium sp.]
MAAHDASLSAAVLPLPAVADQIADNASRLLAGDQLLRVGQQSFWLLKFTEPVQGKNPMNETQATKGNGRNLHLGKE